MTAMHVPRRRRQARALLELREHGDLIAERIPAGVPFAALASPIGQHA
jgi:hypothetical protein